jgi:hypothetical protein
LFLLTGNFSREIQYSKESKRWHIPVLGSNLWLCLNTDAYNSITTDPKIS